MEQLRNSAGLWALCLAVVLVSVPAGALQAKGNLAVTYPGPDCGARPIAPVRPKAFKDNDQISAYNASVRRFNDGNRKYVDCIQRYVNAAAEDIRLIRARIKAVVREASGPPKGADGG